MLLQSVEQLFQVSYFTAAPIGINGEEDRKYQYANRNCAQLIGNVLQPLPQQAGQSDGEQDQKAQHPSPKLGFFALQFAGCAGGERGAIWVRGHGKAIGSLFWPSSFYPQQPANGPPPGKSRLAEHDSRT